MKLVTENRGPHLDVRFHLLDSLRGIAALAVVFFHWKHFALTDRGLDVAFKSEAQPFFKMFSLFYERGYLAVDLFFCLSGFILFWLYLAPIGSRTVSAREFFFLRFSRLYPLHLCTFILVAIGQVAYQSIHGYSFAFQNNDAYHFLLNIFMLSSVGLENGYSFNAPVWSVSVEVVLYGLFFILCRLTKPGPVSLFALSAVGFLALTQMYPPIGRGVGSFFLGGCVYFAYVYASGHKYREAITLALSSLAFGLWAISLCASYWNLSIDDFAQIPHSALFFPVAVLFPITILSLALLERRMASVSRRLAFLGDISYASYLWHFPLQLAFVLVAPWIGGALSFTTSGAALIVFFCILILLATASYRYLEMPAQRAIRRAFLGKAPAANDPPTGLRKQSI